MMDNAAGEVQAYKIDQRTRIIRLYFLLVALGACSSPSIGGPFLFIYFPSAANFDGVDHFDYVGSELDEMLINN